MTLVLTSAEPGTARFQELFREIARDSRERERNRTLPFAQIGWLKDAGFGGVRFSVDEGGDGLDWEQFFALLADLAEADSNIAHAWRGHFEFAAGRLRHPDSGVRAFWRERIVERREMIGNAWSEKGQGASREPRTTVTRTSDGTLRLDGAKHFSTGTIFADWVDVLAIVEKTPYSVVVATDSPGLERFDDWDGFGQPLTGTGTTTFDGVLVEERHLDRHPFTDHVATTQVNIFQLVLLAVQVGIARRALAEVTEYLLGRARPAFGGDGLVAAREDSVIQIDIGRVSAQVYAAEATLARAARALDASDASPGDTALAQAATTQTFQAQAAITPLVLDSTSRVLDAVGASATGADLGLDRHWRNARIIASHNPIRYRERNLGAFTLTGTYPRPHTA